MILRNDDTTESSTSAGRFVNVGVDGKLTTQLYDKQGDFNFAIVSFPYTCSNIPLSPAYAYISLN
jgi:hypothetical protein